MWVGMGEGVSVQPPLHPLLGVCVVCVCVCVCVCACAINKRHSREAGRNSSKIPNLIPEEP